MSSHTGIASQPAHVFRPDELPAKSRGGGARTIPLVTAARGGTTYLNGVTIFGPGSQIAHHIHNVAESVMVIQGDAIVDVDGIRTHLRTFDTTFVPANIPHHFENSSETEEMRIFWTYGSLDATRTVLDTGEHGRVDAEGSAEPTGDVPRIITEIATLDVTPGHERPFEQAVADAAPLFQTAKGARTFVLERSNEHPQRYRLVVGWETLDDHLIGFRGSDAFPKWRALVADHLDAPPTVEHSTHVLTAF